jgi:hypothetical protein
MSKTDKISAPIVVQMAAHKTPEFKESKREAWVEYGSFKERDDRMGSSRRQHPRGG